VSDLTPEHPRGAMRTSALVDELARGQINLHVTVVGPQRQIFAGDAHWVTLPGADGQFGVWPRHVAMVAALGSGPLRIGLPDHSHAEFAVRGAFLSVANNVVTILVDQAVAKDEIVEADARRELEETVAALAHPGDDAEFIQLLDRRAWCQARLKLLASTS
jgi:F-type H+-transporting ATPase subunit epsilon